jgi:glycosyltransferase involved in cell wall biosynthesis
MNRKIVLSINTAWNIHNFRAGLIRALIEHGYEVIALAPRDGYEAKLEAMGCRFIHLAMDNNRANPIKDLTLLRSYYRILRSERPLALCAFTIKPNVYGSLAASALGIPVINNIAGLGATFIHQSLLTRIVRVLYRLSLRNSHRVFFQNRDDRDLFVKAGLARPHLTDCLPGSGMDLTRFQPTPLPNDAEGSFRFLLIARLLKDKGVLEFAEAARITRQNFPRARFQLIGGHDPHNPNAIPAPIVEQWRREGLLEHLGQVEDVRPHVAAAHCVVLPSYREGTPRSLLEAAAMSRPLITTDAVGCREVVDHGVNGLLCKVKDSADLAIAMQEMIRLPLQRRLEMGVAGRKKLEMQFDENIVIGKYLDEIGQVEMRMSSRPRLPHKGSLLPDGDAA